MTGARLLTLAYLATSAFAQQPITFQYFYDDLGQLTKVLDSTGIVIEYIHDPVGNMLAINRSSIAPGALTIFNFTPQSGGPQTAVTIQGQGFSPAPAANTVKFNGTPATVQSATATTLTAIVPTTATTGPIAVTVGPTTASSTTNFTVAATPIITSITPNAILAGTTGVIQVTGLNLSGATFAFLPALSPAAISVQSATISPAGTSASITIAVAASAFGKFTATARNGSGTSTPFPSPSTALTVPGADPNADPDTDGLTNAQEITLGTDPLNPDTDGDGYPDGLEVALNSNPLDPASRPNLRPVPYLTGPTFSSLNAASPAPTTPSLQEVDGSTLSLLNAVSPAPTTPVLREADGSTFSIQNTAPAPPHAPAVIAPAKNQSPQAGAKSPGSQDRK